MLFTNGTNQELPMEGILVPKAVKCTYTGRRSAISFGTGVAVERF